MEHWLLIGLVGYLVLHIVISAIVSRLIRSEADYLLAGRNLGTFLATFSIFASWFGAETILGSSGAIAHQGLSGSRADPFGYTICLLLMGLFLAGQMRARNYVTVGDFFAEHFGRRNEVLGSLIMIPTSLIWAAAQIQAFAMIFDTLLPIGHATALGISVAIVVGYTWLGGMLGDVLNDLIQGTVLIIGLMVVLTIVVLKAGGWAPALASIQPSQLTILAPNETWLTQLNVWAIPILGSLVAPEALSRTLATRDAAVAKRACLFGSGIYFVVALMPVLIALIGTHLMAPVAMQDQFLPTLAKTMLPPWAAVLFLGALVSAILSTIDTTLLSIGGLASHNLLLPVLKNWPALNDKTRSEKSKLLITRGVILLAGLIAYWIAVGGESVYTLAQMASSFGSAGFLVCVIGGLYVGRISAAGATTVLISGIACTLLFEYALQLNTAYLFAILTCAIIYGTFRLLERQKQLATDEAVTPEYAGSAK